jgi:mannose-6-phosphate isomerase-like protein (cupin superfamily)
MTKESKWKVARLDDIERRGRDIPVREHMGIHSFGINAYTPSEEGTLIGEHDETGSAQEELYIVLDGHATFEIDGETVDAPAGTFVYAPPEARRKATGEGTVLALGATPGQVYQALDWGDAWAHHRDSLAAYGEQRYGDALDAVRRGLEQTPDHAGFHYNYACFATLTGDTGDDVIDHLRRSIELYPPFRDQASRDDDFASLRDDPRFESALR